MADLALREWENYKDEKDMALCQQVSGMMRKGIGRSELMEKYAEWAGNNKYEEDLAYTFQGPALTAEAFAETINESLRDNCRILDVGAGTGLVAEKLKSIGFNNIDALDPSKEMLDVAKEKGVYTQFFEVFLTGEDRLPIESDAYDGIAATGCFVEGHVPCAGLFEMIRIVKPGGVIIIVTRYDYLDIVEEYRGRLEPLMEQLEAEGKWERVSRQIKSDYYLDKKGIVWIYRVL